MRRRVGRTSAIVSGGIIFGCPRRPGRRSARRPARRSRRWRSGRRSCRGSAPRTRGCAATARSSGERAPATRRARARRSGRRSPRQVLRRDRPRRGTRDRRGEPAHLVARDRRVVVDGDRDHRLNPEVVEGPARLRAARRDVRQGVAQHVGMDPELQVDPSAVRPAERKRARPLDAKTIGTCGAGQRCVSVAPAWVWARRVFSALTTCVVSSMRAIVARLRPRSTTAAVRPDAEDDGVPSAAPRSTRSRPRSRRPVATAAS